MGNFVIVILILACIGESVQLKQPSYMTECWNQWRVVRDWKNTPSAWLEHVYLVEEICKSGVRVEEMDKCTRQYVDVNAENVLAYWNGIRDKYYKVCSHYSDYLRYRSCRTNRHVIHAYNFCPRLYHGNGCSDQQNRSRCLKDSIQSNCKTEPAEFFTNLIDTEFAPLFHYMGCSKDHFDGVEYVRMKDRTLVKTDITTTTRRPKHDGGMEEIKEEDIIVNNDVLDLGVAVNSASTNTLWSLVTIFTLSCFSKL